MEESFLVKKKREWLGLFFMGFTPFIENRKRMSGWLRMRGQTLASSAH